MTYVFVVSRNSCEKRNLSEVKIIEKSYNDHGGMCAATIEEREVAVKEPDRLPSGAILIAFTPRYFFKHNTKVFCPRGREIARGYYQDKKQCHEHLLAWLMSGERIQYRISGKVGAESTFCRGSWVFDGTHLCHEVEESRGESGPWGSRYMVHGKTGIRSKIPIDCKTVSEMEQVAAEVAARIEAAGALVEAAISAALPELNAERERHHLPLLKIMEKSKCVIFDKQKVPVWYGGTYSEFSCSEELWELTRWHVSQLKILARINAERKEKGLGKLVFTHFYIDHVKVAPENEISNEHVFAKEGSPLHRSGQWALTDRACSFWFAN